MAAMKCPECREELVVVPDEEAMQRTHRHAGIYCPNGHVERLFELRSVHERIRDVFERLRRDPPEHSEAPTIDVHPEDGGWLECPGCQNRFTLRDHRFGEGGGLWRHGCGQRVRWEGQI
jgi:uncharacterized protein YbaR (Trm112 family)